MKAWHISDTHFSFDKDWVVLKPMNERKWALGAWTYTGYLDRMAEFGTNKITDEDFVFVTGDIVHDMKESHTASSIRWMRHHVKGTLIICRGNHDKAWEVGKMRQKVGHLENVYLIDEGEILNIGPYTIGCFSDHSKKTEDFENSDGRYLEMAMNIAARAKEKDTIPVMISHYPVNANMAALIGKTGVKAYMSGHIHCTDANNPSGEDPSLNWDWYDKSAAQTDDLSIEGCFFSTATTDVVQARHKQSFKEITALAPAPEPVKKNEPKTCEMLLMCGLPGSGKSTVATILGGMGYTRVNQDELGSRKACYRLAEEAIQNNKSVVIDRCNFDENQRKSWVGLARGNGVKSIRIVNFAVSAAKCLERANTRTDHPTITTPEIAEKAVSSIASKFTNPTTEEGFTWVVSTTENETPEEIVQRILRKDT